MSLLNLVRQRLRDSQLVSMTRARSQSVTTRPRSVYVMKIGERYKIGLSFKPDARGRNMQLPEKPFMLQVHEVDHAEELERLLHKRFHDKREYGEWFLLHADDLKQIETIAEEWKIGGAFLR